jgi:hypothetical protein
MESWMPFFVIVIALTVVMQSIMLIVLFMNLRRTAVRIEQIVIDLNARMSPILSNLQRLVEDLSPRISSVVEDAAEITHLARNQTQKVDRVVSETLERLRLQIIHVDHLITGAIDVVEEAGSRVKQTVWGPVVQAAAVVRGIQTGLNFWRNMRRVPEPVVEPRERQDKGMVV